MTSSHATPVPPQHSSEAFRSTGQDEEFHVRQGSPTLLGLLDDALMEWERYATPGITTGADWHFGDAGSGENGIRSAANFVFASAFRWKQYGNQLSLDWARRGLDYLLAGHRTGEGACADGQRWGHAWQSSWWCGKMALGAHLIWAELSRQQREAVARVVASEAGALLLRAVPTGLALDTKAEENAWDTEVLATALLLMPEHPDCGAWAEKLNAFAMNTLSRAVDHERLDLVEGKPVADWLTSANLFHDFTIENHGSCHFCYVASPLASLTWARASFLLSGRPAPESLSFNKAAFWNKHKSLFLDRRFAYVGGQDWARYTYGEYFIVPAAVSIAARLDDRFAQHVAAQRVKMLRLEQRRNGDGSFFSRRVTRRLYQGQAAKYETDCFAHLALARLLLDLEPATSEGPADRVVRPAAVHLGYETQVAWTRTEAFFASFSPQALQSGKPLALFAPAGHDDVVEWMPGNLCGHVEFPRRDASNLRVLSLMPVGALGFRLEGVVLYRQGDVNAIEQRISITADADSNALTVKSSAKALRKMWIKEAFGLNLAVVNDIFNDERRLYRLAGGMPLAVSANTRRRTVVDKLAKRLFCSLPWRERVHPAGADQVHVDDAFCVRTPSQPLWVRQSAEQSASNSLRYDVLGCGPLRRNFVAKPGETLFSYEAHLRCAVD